jgi:hypothetical protein
MQLEETIPHLIVSNPAGIAARIAMALLCLAVSASAYSQVYKWMDKDGKIHYSDKPPPVDAIQQTPITKPSPARPPSGEAKGKPETGQSNDRRETSSVGKFRPEENAGLCVLFEINSAQIGCTFTLGKFCSLDELAEGVGPKKVKVLSKDPRLDPNYEHRLTIRQETYAWSAIPRRPGLTGFFYDGRRTYYNPNGPATDRDKEVTDADCK